jgi:periplasmic protein TonB
MAVRFSPLLSFLSISAACHVGLFLGFGSDDTTVYQISMDESVSAVAVNIVAAQEEVPEPKKAKPKSPKKEEQLLTTEEKTKEIVEKTPPVENVQEIEQEPIPIVEVPEEIPEKVEKEELPEEVTTENVPESPELKQAQQQESNISASTKDMRGAFTKSRPAINRCPAPRYPQQAREKGIEGKVILKVTVDEDGNVRRVRLEKSSGSKILDRRAVITVRKRWHFEPARRGAKTVESELNVELLFRLKK